MNGIQSRRKSRPRPSMTAARARADEQDIGGDLDALDDHQDRQDDDVGADRPHQEPVVAPAQRLGRDRRRSVSSGPSGPGPGTALASSLTGPARPARRDRIRAISGAIGRPCRKSAEPTTITSTPSRPTVPAVAR